MYYELTPTQSINEETGLIEWDFNGYYARIDAILEGLPELQRDEFIGHIQRDWTPLQRLRWQDTREYLRAYSAVWLVELKTGGYTEEQQLLIQKYVNNPSSAEGNAIKDTAMYGEDKLISRFQTRKTLARRNWRIIDPELDAVLRFWGKVTDNLTVEGERLYNERIAQVGTTA